MIYFLQSTETPEDGPIKIGYTDDPNLKNRVDVLQTGNPYPLRVLGVIASGTTEDEVKLHFQFKKLRMYGEWFRCGQSLKNFIKAESKGYVWGGQYWKIRRYGTRGYKKNLVGRK